jgi:hypothetical protein
VRRRAYQTTVSVNAPRALTPPSPCARVKAIHQKLDRLDLPELIGDRVRVIQDPGQPSDVASIAEASALSGMSIQMPEWLPEGARMISLVAMDAGDGSREDFADWANAGFIVKR